MDEALEDAMIEQIDGGPVALTKSSLAAHAAWLESEGREGARLDLSDANLSDANLTRADLSGAYLTSAYLARAYLARANLADADLSGADLTGANLSGANLSGVKGLRILDVSEG